MCNIQVIELFKWLRPLSFEQLPCSFLPCCEAGWDGRERAERSHLWCNKGKSPVVDGRVSCWPFSTKGLRFWRWVWDWGSKYKPCFAMSHSSSEFVALHFILVAKCNFSPVAISIHCLVAMSHIWQLLLGCAFRTAKSEAERSKYVSLPRHQLFFVWIGSYHVV